MTDLKELLDNAAGTEPAVTDDDLMADLRRGKRSARRRQVVAMAGGATAVALVVVGAWAVLPGDPSAGLAPQPAEQVSGTPTIDRTTIRKIAGVQKPAVKPIGLVASGEAPPGARMWCDLKPVGWTPKVGVPAADEVAALTFLPPGGGASAKEARLAIPRHSASEPGVGGIEGTTPLATLHLDDKTQFRWIDSCHEVG
jgi:hypothetical protein